MIILVNQICKYPIIVPPVSLYAGGHLLALNDPTGFTQERGVGVIRAALDDGSALDKYRRMIIAQGVKPELAENICKEMQNVDDVWNHLPKANHETNLNVSIDGKLFTT